MICSKCLNNISENIKCLLCEEYFCSKKCMELYIISSHNKEKKTNNKKNNNNLNDNKILILILKKRLKENII